MIEDLSEKKRKTFSDIEQRIKEEAEREAAAMQAASKATESLDTKAFHDAQVILSDIAERKQMLNNRASQLASYKIVSEEESDAVIDSLKEYVEDLSAEFRAAADNHVEALLSLYEDYKSAVDEASRAINGWTSQIHPNYRSMTASRFLDGKHTNRMEAPVPVYPGYSTPVCSEALNIRDFLKAMNKIW